MPATFIKTPFMSQHALDACDENAMLNAMLAFELALAEVQAVSYTHLRAHETLR